MAKPGSRFADSRTAQPGQVGRQHWPRGGLVGDLAFAISSARLAMRLSVDPRQASRITCSFDFRQVGVDLRAGAAGARPCGLDGRLRRGLFAWHRLISLILSADCQARPLKGFRILFGIGLICDSDHDISATPAHGPYGTIQLRGPRGPLADRLADRRGGSRGRFTGQHLFKTHPTYPRSLTAVSHQASHRWHELA